MHIIICCVIGLATVVAGESIDIEQYKQFILDESNRYRKMAKASDMIELVWDDQLAKEADAWVNRCEFKHQMKGRGENLAWSSMKNTNEELTKDAMKRWYDEIKMYRYTKNSCGRSCHYTQMIWAKTTKIGCGMKKCSQLRNAGSNAWYLACFYDPMGNMIGDYPYSTGPTCSACPEGCKDGLCTAGLTSMCNNMDAKCDEWAKDGECDNNAKWMISNCKKACNKCA